MGASLIPGVFLRTQLRENHTSIGNVFGSVKESQQLVSTINSLAQSNNDRSVTALSMYSAGSPAYVDMTGNYDDDDDDYYYGGGGKWRANTTGNDNDGDGEGKPRANNTDKKMVTYIYHRDQIQKLSRSVGGSYLTTRQPEML